MIEVTSVTAGLIGSTTIPIGMWDYIPTGEPGTIRVANNVDGVTGVSGPSGYLAEINFDVVGAVGMSSPISFSNGMLGNTDNESIPGVTWTDGSVSVADTLTADFTADNQEVLVDQSIAFTDDTSGGSGVYSTYDWDFGDGGSSTLANPTHSYADPGTYTVFLTVTESLGSSDTETRTGYITVYPALAAVFSSDISEAVVGQDISFNSGTTAGGKTPYTYSWDFGDTGSSTAANPTHSFGASGNYTVSLTVTDSLGNSDTDTAMVHIYKLGDANKDGYVNMLDVTYIENIIMEHSGYVYTTWADAKQDGTINVLDITATEWIILP